MLLVIYLTPGQGEGTSDCETNDSDACMRMNY